MVNSEKPFCLPSVLTHAPSLPLFSAILAYNAAIFGLLIQITLPVACLILRKIVIRFLSIKFAFQYLVSTYLLLPEVYHKVKLTETDYKRKRKYLFHLWDVRVKCIARRN